MTYTYEPNFICVPGESSIDEQKKHENELMLMYYNDYKLKLCSNGDGNKSSGIPRFYFKVL